MKPIRYESGIPFFSKSECAIYGLPDYFGYTDYVVVDDEQPVYVHDYSSSIERRVRPIHRYNRNERFVFTLSQLLGLRGDIDGEILAMCAGCKTWEDIRGTLQQNGKQRYYNRIPSIMNILRLPPPIEIEITNNLFLEIVSDFKKCQQNFKQTNLIFERKYFPSLRFIAIKLLQKHGAVFDPDIKFIRTRHKLKSLDILWKWIS
jgi:hypothetical protein